MSKIVIGLAGVKTSGKSTAANMIREFVNAKEVALADKLKNTCAEVFGLERNQFDAQELKEVPFETPIELAVDDILNVLKSFNIKMGLIPFAARYDKLIGMELETPRKIAQIVGTEILRATGNPDIHCDSVSIEEGVTIISDLRFPNEFEYFSKKDGIKFIPLHIQRDVAEAEVTEDSHPSEKCVFEFTDKCITINNNGSLSETERQIKQVLDNNL